MKSSTAAASVDSFEGRIGPRNLLGLIHNTADFLFHDLRPTPATPPASPANAFESARLAPFAFDSLGYIDILRVAEHLSDDHWKTSATMRGAAFVDYFTLCLAAHHATVATFVPTDVDSKIRGLLWEEAPGNHYRRMMLAIAEAACAWDIAPLSTRSNEHSGVGPVSGHNGEQLGVLSGALGSFLRHHDEEFGAHAAALIVAELTREAHEFEFVRKQQNMEIELLQLSASLTHNIGDLNQGINYWTNVPENCPYRFELDRDHGPATQWKKELRIAHLLYKNVMAAEGHRHYPLRGVAALRRGKSLLLPLAPFLDDWGSRIAQSSLLNDEERAQVLAALLTGCKKIPGQVGYFRAIAGMAEGLGGSLGSLEKLAKLMPNSARALLKDSTIRQMAGIRRASFESTMRKRVRELLR